MLHQNDPQGGRALRGHVPDSRRARAPYEVAYLMKLGGLNQATAVALIAKHRGDNFNILAELFSLRPR